MDIQSYLSMDLRDFEYRQGHSQIQLVNRAEDSAFRLACCLKCVDYEISRSYDGEKYCVDVMSLLPRIFP